MYYLANQDVFNMYDFLRLHTLTVIKQYLGTIEYHAFSCSMVLKSVWSSALFWKMKLVVDNWITKCEAMPLKWELSLVVDITHTLTHYFYLFFWTACYKSCDTDKKYFSFATKSGKDQDSSATAGTFDISRHSELHQIRASVCFVLKHHTIKNT